MKLIRSFGFLVLFVLSASFVLGADRIQMVDTFGATSSLTFGSGVSQSYLDNVGTNPDIALRVYSSQDDLEDGYACLAYSIGTSFVPLSFGTQTPGADCAKLEGSFVYNATHNYSQTSIDSFGLSSTAAYYPGIVVGVLSQDAKIDLADQFIALDPARDGWFEGADGGVPCQGGGGLWNRCGADLGADSVYDSYDVSAKQIGASLRVWVNATYYPVSAHIAAQSTIDTDAIVVGIARDDGTILDSGITSLYDVDNGPDIDDSDDFVDLSFGGYEGDLTLLVNGIRTAVYSVVQQGFVAGSPAAGGGSGGEGNSGGGVGSSGDSFGKNEWRFSFNGTIQEVIVHLRDPVADAWLQLANFPYEDDRPVYESISFASSFDEDNIVAVFIQFSVEEAWLLDYGIYKNDLFVAYQEDELYSVPARLISDKEGFSYAARIPNLRPFVIGGVRGEKVSLSQTEQAELTALYPRGGIALPIYLWWLLIIIILLILWIVIVERNHRKHEKRREDE